MTDPLAMPQHYTCREAVARLDELGIPLSVRKLRDLIARGEIGCRRPGGRVVIGEDQLQDYLQHVTEKPAWQGDGNPANTGLAESAEANTGTSTGTTERLDVSAARRRALRIVEKPKRGKPNSSSSECS